MSENLGTLATNDKATAPDCAFEVNNELLERIRLLERSVESIHRSSGTSEIGSLQRWRFAVVVLLHGVIATSFTLLSTVLPNVFVNGWMLGSFLWALIWFEASPRAIADRASRLFISSLLIIWMLYEATVVSYGMFPDVTVLAVFVAPFVMLISRWMMACFRTSLNAPDIQHRRVRPLSILDFGTATTLAALLFACLRTQEPAAIFKPLVVIGFTIVPALVLGLMIVGLAATSGCLARASIVSLAVVVLAIATWVALTLAGNSIEDLSWVEIDSFDSFANSTKVPNRQMESQTAFCFAVSLVMPCSFTLALLHFQGYQLVVSPHILTPPGGRLSGEVAELPGAV